MSAAAATSPSYWVSPITFTACPIEIWFDDDAASAAGMGISAQTASLEALGAADEPTLTLEPFDEIELPLIEEVDAWLAVEELEVEAARAGGEPPWSAKDAPGGESGISRPATVSAVAALLLGLAVVHGLGALGTLSWGLNQSGIGSAVIAGALALTVGIGEVVCAVQVTRGKSWARVGAAALGGLVLLWLTMAPWSPGTLTVAVFAVWLVIGALLAHPRTSRFLAATASAN